MSRIGDFFNRIKNRIMPNKTLQLPENVYVNPVLKEKMNQRTLEIYSNPNNYNDYCKQFFSVDGNFQSQYDYLEVVSNMQQNGAMDEFERYFIEVQNNSGLYYPSKVHGIEHTSRVVFYAEMLCSLDGISSHERDLIMRAAQLHDIGREDDLKNFDHGLASKYKIEQYGLLDSYPNEDQEIIKFAVANHSLEPEQVQEKLQEIPRRDRKKYKKVLDYLQDADKLDRTRIANKGWGLDPNRLASDTAKRLVKVSHENFWEFSKLIDYELNKQAYQGKHNARIEAYNQVVQKGYNITFQDFESITNEYQDGVLEMLLSQNRIEDIFAYKTFLQYSISEGPESIKEEHDKIFSEINQNNQIETVESTYNAEFMLYYSLKMNNPEAYQLLNYANVDIAAPKVIGVANQIQISDLEKFFAKGYYLRTSDLFYLASNLTPDEYRNVIDSGNLEDLFSSKYEKSSYNYEQVSESLKRFGINYDKETIDRNYRFIEKIISERPGILKNPNISSYSFSEIYTAITKLSDASSRLTNETSFSFSENDVIELMNFSRQDQLIYKVGENEQLDIVEQLVQDKDVVKDPRYIQYVLKKNKPYTTNKASEILNYNEYCADEILLDNNITLQDAKSRLINGFFNLDVPKENRGEFEKELEEELYYHKKYLSQSDLYEKDENVTSQITQILSAKTIGEFKDLLFKYKESINRVNTHNLGDKIKTDLIDVTRRDIVYNLKQTGMQIHTMPESIVQSESGRQVRAKVLNGQDFYLAISTAMPKCSARTYKIMRAGNENAAGEIYGQMLNTELNPKQICTSIVSDKMIAHAQSSLQDQELKFGFIPDDKDDISISAMYDLSSTKDKFKNRTTNKPITPRRIDDLISGTTEEHNETVMNAYPDFIVCYDKITDIAIEKQIAMQQEYGRKGINKKIEIVLIDGKNRYLPQIRSRVEREHEAIEQKLRTGSLTESDFSKMFENHESNFVLRTLQSMHSSSYRDDTWNEDYNMKIIDSMTRILEEVTRIVPEDKARYVLDQVNLLLNRSDRSTRYGSRFYDHSYADDLDTRQLQAMKHTLSGKTYSYERSLSPQKTNLTEQTQSMQQALKLEEINVGEIKENVQSVKNDERKKSDDEAR